MSDFLTKIDSNVTGLRFCEEVTIGVLPVAASQIWYPLEPNSYANWGGQTKLTQRSPITDTRQKRKGVLTDLDAAGSINMDMTLTNYQRVMQGFMFASFREKFDTDSYVGVNTAAFAVATTSTFKLEYGDQLSTVHQHNLILTTGFTNAQNNGLFHVSSVSNVAATGSVNDTAGAPDDGDAFTIGGTEYIFKTALTPAAHEVLIGGSAVNAIAHLVQAVTYDGGAGTHAGTNYVGTAPNANVTAAVDVTTTIADITALRTGHAGNTLGLAATVNVSTNLAVSGALLTGGTADIVVTETTLVNEASPPVAARIEVVGVEFASGDAEIVNSGSAYPALTTSTFDLTTLGLIPGEFAYIGGDTAASAFATDTDNGFVRVRAVATHTLTLDKTTGEMVTDVGTAKTIQLFFGRVVKNEANHDGPNSSIPIKRRTYQFERTLGSPDIDNPTFVQAEYLKGSVPNTFKMTLKTADKVASDMDFVALNTDLRTTDEGPKSQDEGAVAPPLSPEEAFNTTSHIARMRLAALSSTDADPQALVGFISDFDFTIDNMLKANKALGVLGAFEVTAGHFQVSGTLKAYFATVEAQTEVKENGDITLDIAFVEANKGIVIDMPLIALSDGRPDVVSDEPIMLPLNLELAPDPLFNHELLWVFFDYLPSAAQPEV